MLCGIYIVIVVTILGWIYALAVPALYLAQELVYLHYDYLLTRLVSFGASFGVVLGVSSGVTSEDSFGSASGVSFGASFGATVGSLLGLGLGSGLASGLSVSGAASLSFFLQNALVDVEISL